MDRTKTAFFTGHRNINQALIRPYLLRMIIDACKDGSNHFISGMAVGTDMLAAKILSEMGLSWSAALPCPADQQCQNWQSQEKKQYWELLEKATQLTIVSPKYSRQCFQLRNIWMAEQSSLCLAVYDGVSTGGTANTLKVCKKLQIPVISLHPQTLNLNTSHP